LVDIFIKYDLSKFITSGTDKFNTGELQPHRVEGIRDYPSVRGKS
jgi:hypothetical protein